MYRRPIRLVDGGSQKRSFTFIDDAIDCLLQIIENREGCASRRIFNIGNPHNCVSIEELAGMMVDVAEEFPELAERAKATEITTVTAGDYYGRLPDIESIAFRPSKRPPSIWVGLANGAARGGSVKPSLITSRSAQALGGRQGRVTAGRGCSIAIEQQ
jgi:hypothetical protein